MVGVENGIIRLYIIEVKGKECGGDMPYLCDRLEIASQIPKSNVSMRAKYTKQHPVWTIKM